MQRWEYHVMTPWLEGVTKRKWRWHQGIEGLQAIEDLIDEWGAAGWELVGVMPVAGFEGVTQSAHLWFKRPISEEQADAYLSQKESERQAVQSDLEAWKASRAKAGPVKCPGCGRMVTAGATRCGACGAWVGPGDEPGSAPGPTEDPDYPY